MLSFFNSAFNKMLRKRKRATDEAPTFPEDSDTAATEHHSMRKRHHCAPPDPPPGANKAWCCRSLSGCQAGTSSSNGAEELASDCHLARMGSVSLELRKPAALSDLAALPSDVLQTVFQQLPLPDRLALRQSCRALTSSIPYGGLHLTFPMSRQHQQVVPALADRPAIRKLTFEQTCSGRMRKRAFKNLLSRLGPPVGQDRRYELRVCVNSVLSASDLAWMEAALDTYGLLQHAVSLDLCCIDADFAGALQKVPVLRLTAESLSESTCEAIEKGHCRNLESIHLTHLREEEEVQLALMVADRAVLGSLRHLTLEAAGGQGIPLGCRGQHPDLSHLAHLSIHPNIALCVNFLRYLASLRACGLAVCGCLQRSLEEWAAQRTGAMFVLWFGNVEDEQHGFLHHGDFIVEIEV
ncbi:g10999 [Coccomyxa elongata]